ncbi:MAG: glycoside hydrolase family 5 protein [Legionellales bacterium]|nr:glycoside hydrolase family 5 protein [Legionellales bacterium]
MKKLLKTNLTRTSVALALLFAGTQVAMAQTVVMVNKMANDPTTNNSNMLCFEASASVGVPEASQYNLNQNGSVWLSAGAAKQQAQYTVRMNTPGQSCASNSGTYGGYIGIGTDPVSSGGYAWDFSGDLAEGVALTQSPNPSVDCGAGADVCYVVSYTPPSGGGSSSGGSSSGGSSSGGSGDGGSGNGGGASYPNVQTYSSGVAYRGVNLSGAEFADDGSGQAQKGAFTPTIDDAALFLYRGMNVYRVPITWEYIADINGNLKTDADGQQYLTKLDSVITDLLAKNAYVLLDLHNYMRYNPSNVTLNYLNTDPNGSDVIGSGANAPTKVAYENLWKNLATHFNQPNMMYDIMNEPHDMPMSQVLLNQNAAIQGIRTAEGSAAPHLIMIEGNYWTGLHSWTKTTTSDQANSQAYPAGIVDSKNNYAFEVHQYFDPNSSGQYTSGDCLSSTDFMKGYTSNGTTYPGFPVYWEEFTKWAKTNKAKVFLGEFGSPDTSNCRADIKTVLDNIDKFPYDSTTGGFLGWSVWAAGGSWGNYVISIAPGGPANTLMWDNELYENYLTATQDLPALGPKMLSFTNESLSDLLFSSGAWPFQMKGSATLTPGQTVYIYSPDSTTSPAGQYELTYHLNGDGADVIGVGVNDGYGYSYGVVAGISPVLKPTCDITGSNGDTKRCWLAK